MNRIINIWNLVSTNFLEYETQKVVQIHSKKVGGVFRLIQLSFVLYVVIWVMIWEKGYQKEEKAQSGVTAKLKGVAYANLTDNPTIGASVWDAADYVIPPMQKAAFFVMTNRIITPGQSMSRCEESHDVHRIACRVDGDCESGTLVMVGSGIRTGKCVNSTRQKELRVCEIYGWCPTEHDIVPEPNLLSSAPNFTVILKNSIEFPMYKVKRRNILSWMTKKFLYTCRYDPNHEAQKFCPIFRLSDILKYSGAQNQNIWTRGGMISITIEWKCNLDYSVDHCKPEYKFRRLDDFESVVGKGWNFRYSQHYIENGIHKRNLIKAYGIQFFIEVYGSGGKFNLLAFTMNLGSGLALLGIATVLCDMIVLNVTRKRGVYRNAKVDLVVKQERRVLRRKHSLEQDHRLCARMLPDSLVVAEVNERDSRDAVDRDAIWSEAISNAEKLEDSVVHAGVRGTANRRIIHRSAPQYRLPRCQDLLEGGLFEVMTKENTLTVTPLSSGEDALQQKLVDTIAQYAINVPGRAMDEQLPAYTTAAEEADTDSSRCFRSRRQFRQHRAMPHFQSTETAVSMNIENIDLTGHSILRFPGTKSTHSLTTISRPSTSTNTFPKTSTQQIPRGVRQQTWNNLTPVSAVNRQNERDTNGVNTGFRPDLGLFRGVPRSVVRALSPPAPK